ncbi:MAG TPA: amidase [Planktothrix sp. UBA8402]|nr:amidase [Planktothrix sp. UBA8402]
MNSVDLAFTPALEQARLIRTKFLSPLELVNIYLDRIQRLNPLLGCYFTVMADMALELAKTQTEQLVLVSDINDLPPFFGVPISIKDLNPVAGVACTYGSRALVDQIATYDDGVVSRIRQAGFNILGKTATSEIGSLPYTEPDGFPPARNPWNLDYTPGGSSGGAAAAVAAGLSSVAHGSDGGGSVRGPAFCCGLVGIKPTRGRVSHAPVGDFQSGISTDGPLARTVADAAALLDIMSGYILGDPYWLPAPNPSFLAATQQPPKSLKIAIATSVLPIDKISPDCEQAVKNTVKLLEQLGHQIEPINLDFSDIIEPFILVWKSGVASAGIPPEYLGSVNQWLIETQITAGQYLQAVSKMQVGGRQIVASLSPFDIVVLPTYMSPAIRVGEYAQLSPEETLQRITEWISPCPGFNVSGQPAIAIPTGFTPEGLPVGVQLVGKPATEATLIALAAQLEALQPWENHRPPMTI